MKISDFRMYAWSLCLQISSIWFPSHIKIECFFCKLYIKFSCTWRNNIWWCEFSSRNGFNLICICHFSLSSVHDKSALAHDLFVKGTVHTSMVLMTPYLHYSVLVEIPCMKAIVSGFFLVPFNPLHVLVYSLHHIFSIMWTSVPKFHCIFHNPFHARI